MARLSWIVHQYGVVLMCVCVIAIAAQESASPSPSPTPALATDGESDNEMSSLAKGVQPLFEMTNVFLGNIVQPHRIGDSFNISVFFDGSFFSNPQETWKPLAEYFVGFLVCGIFGLLFIVIFPIVGLVFCCCRCCGRCGGKAGSHDPKSAKCKRVSCGIALIVINTLSLSAVVCLFFTNELLHVQTSDSNKGAISRIENSVQSLEKYINESYLGLNDKTLELYDQKIWSPTPGPHQGQLLQNINYTAAGAVDQVLQKVNVTEALDKAKVLSRDVNATLDSLLAVEVSLENLTSLGQQLHDNLTEIQGEIIKKLEDAHCNKDVCINVLPMVRNLKMEANFSRLDRLRNISSTVRNDVNVQRGIDEAESHITRVKESAKEKVQTEVNKAVNIARKIREDIKSALESVQTQLKQVKIPASTQRSLNDAKIRVDEYGKYWWYAGIGISCLCLLIVVFHYFGLLYGFCGERPGEDAQCCHRGMGANLLMAGVGFSFLFGWLLMLVTVILFIPGGVVYTEVCRYMNSHNPQELQVLDSLSDLLDLSSLYNSTERKLTLASILEDCENNTSVYEALQLQHVFDIQKYLNLTDLDKILDEISLVNLQVDELTVPPGLIDALKKFGEAGFQEINTTEYKSQIDQNLTSVNLYDLASTLERVGTQLANSSTKSLHGPDHQGDLNRTLHNQSAQLRRISDTIIGQMKIQVTILNDSVNNLETKIDMKSVTEQLINSIQEAENKFNTNGTDILKNILPEETKKVKESVSSFAQDVAHQITKEVGKCRPVYDAIYSVSDVACKDVLNPVNGFWFSLGWVLFFIIPSIILAVKLAGLYRKEDEYVPGTRILDDLHPETYSNGEAHSDTIPLTSKYQWQ
ncbi:prominin-1-A-like isoform X2 [Liolophura sinensis]|uniref:prominin-1-A-like isoform X2 n=1 Tax=Liolophura sinensis TaxID=3198878 RepID=UPI003158FE1C